MKIKEIKYTCEKCGNIYVEVVKDGVLSFGRYLCANDGCHMYPERIEEVNKKSLVEEIQSIIICDKALRCLHNSVPELLASEIAKEAKKYLSKHPEEIGCITKERMFEKFDNIKDNQCPLRNGLCNVKIELKRELDEL